MLTYGLAIRAALILASGLFCCIASSAHAESQYPILDKVAERVVQKYQTSSCEQLAAERSHPKPEKKRKWKSVWCASSTKTPTCAKSFWAESLRRLPTSSSSAA